jgi:hypothetical protein
MNPARDTRAPSEQGYSSNVASQVPAQPGSRLTVRFHGPGVSPKTIPLRSLTRVLEAVTTIVGGEKRDETVDLYLSQVRRGSARYKLGSEHPAPLLTQRLRIFGSVVVNESPEGSDFDIAEPLKILSAEAKRNNCEIELIDENDGAVLAKIEPDSYGRFMQSAFVEGEGSVWAKIERVGGRQSLHCAVRVPRQDEQVWCQVSSEDLVRTLGDCILEHVMLFGHLTWYRRSWRIRGMQIRSVERPKTGSLVDAMKAAHTAGGSAWANLGDPLAKLADIRGE